MKNFAVTTFLKLVVSSSYFRSSFLTSFSVVLLIALNFPILDLAWNSLTYAVALTCKQLCNTVHSYSSIVKYR